MRRSAVLVAIGAAVLASSAPAGRAASSAPLDLTPFVANADFPSNMAFAPDGRLFYTEKDTGRIRIVEDGRLLPDPFAEIPVQGGGESGLLGLALDPDFGSSPFVYVYFTGPDGHNHLARLRADGDRGGAPENLLTLLPVSGIHNGGDMVFGPDGKLYVVVGETGNESLAQDPASLGGKILRLNTDGSIPDDNPTPGSPVYSLGHRNSFGLCVDPSNGDLWETENGPDRFDEVNRIVAGGNYGWPDQLGPGGGDRFVTPVLAFKSIIVPTGCVFAGGALYFGDFHADLHQVTLQPPDRHNATGVTTVARTATGITDLQVGPDGMLYVATSDAILRGPVPAAPQPSVPNEPGGRPQPPSTGDSGPNPAGIALAVVVGLAVLALLASLVARRRARRT
jgi:glucose/arabinose dehydrogenase